MGISVAALSMLGLFLPGQMLASEPSAKPARVKKVVKPAATEPSVVVTGSRIPRRATASPNGLVTEMPLVVIDQGRIHRSGAASVAEVLRRTGTAR